MPNSSVHIVYNGKPLKSGQTCYWKVKAWADFRDMQRPSGQLPGIIPTGGWGFNWGSGSAWDSAVILIPWYMYLYCGDTKILDEMYDCMKSYVDFLNSMAVGHIVDFGLGDWCPPDDGAEGHKCPVAVTGTGYYYVDVKILGKIAKILGKDEDRRQYENLAEKIKAAFCERFLDMQTGVVTGDCQTSMACALLKDLLTIERK